MDFQPYIRVKPEEHKKTLEDKELIASDPNTIKKSHFDAEGNAISRKKIRRKDRRPVKPEGYHERSFEPCRFCDNPKGVTFHYKLCRTFCRDKCYKLLKK